MAGKKPFAVVTDSTADLPSDWARQHGIRVVPLKVMFGNETFRDGVDLTSDQFFERLRAADRLPTTSAPAPGEFAEAYRELARDHEGCVSIHLGTFLSGTVASARAGAATVEGFPVHVVDSGSVTMTIAFLCQAAAEASTLEEAVKRVQERLPKQRILCLLDTLRYVEMGGRVNRAQAMIGALLDLKPILRLVPGEIRGVDRARTRSRGIPRLLELLRRELPVERLAVVHAQAAEDAERMREELAGEVPDLEISTAQIGSVLGTHVGPRALGFAYLQS
ncbi:MAG TPA: DegV family protein [Candidatus Acidoferrales bacterium]|nr:DegV family protein [Candidatus Acidoferrales bacterium]